MKDGGNSGYEAVVHWKALKSNREVYDAAVDAAGSSCK